MLKKTLLGFGFVAALSLASAFACDSAGKSSGSKASAEVSEGASQASGNSALASDIALEGKAPGHEGKGLCLRKSASGKSAAKEGSSAQCKRSAKAGKASASGDQHMASSGIDCPKSADCPKADCDHAACLKKSGNAGAGADGKQTMEAKVGTEI